jgi:RNA polymerase sigma-70 factor (ECF subfamily)
MAPEVDLEQRYDAHAQALYGFLMSLTRNESDTRDLLQELFIKLARQPSLLAQVRDPRGFLLRMAHNLAIDLMRRQTTRERNHTALAAGIPEPFARAEDPDTGAFGQALADALTELPPDQRAVVHLKLWEGATFEAIAEILQISPNTAASRYRYGIDKLQERLRPLYEELKS